MESPRAPHSLPFVDWTQALRSDCNAKEKLVAYDALGDTVLKMFWERGTEPTVDAIINSAPPR